VGNELSIHDTWRKFYVSRLVVYTFFLAALKVMY
jgi:hypothetical protein